MRAQIESKSRVWWSVAFLVQRQSLANHYLTTEAKHQDCVSTIVTIICITVTIFFKDFRIPCQANRNISKNSKSPNTNKTWHPLNVTVHWPYCNLMSCKSKYEENRFNYERNHICPDQQVKLTLSLIQLILWKNFLIRTDKHAWNNNVWNRSKLKTSPDMICSQLCGKKLRQKGFLAENTR